MARRRADEEPGLIDRVRWRNVGRSGVLLVAVLAVALTPRGCGRREAQLPPEVRVAPPVAPPTPEKAEGRRQKAGRVRPRRHKRRRHHRRPAPKPQPNPKPIHSPAPQTAAPAPAPRYVAPPPPEFF